jgi:hypothetical protein
MPTTKLRQAVEALEETEELTEVTDWYTKAAELVRMGLMPTNTLPYLKRALTQMEQGQYMSAPERKTFYAFVEKVMEIALLDPVVSRQVKNKAAKNHFSEGAEESVDESTSVRERSRKFWKHGGKSALDGQNIPAISKRTDSNLKDFASSMNVVAPQIKKEPGKSFMRDAGRVAKKELNKRALAKEEVVSEGPLDAFHAHPRANTPLSQQSKGLQAKVRRDIEAHKAKKAAAIDSAKAELAAHFSTKKGEREAKKALWVSKRAASHESVEESKKTETTKKVASPPKKVEKEEKPAKPKTKRQGTGDGGYHPFNFGSIGEQEVSDFLVMEDINFRETPDGMLSQLANIIHKKRRAGGRPTDNDKKLATRAKNELRRRRNAKKVPEAVSYEDRLNASMQFFGLISLADLDPAKSKAFFTHVETQGVE